MQAKRAFTKCITPQMSCRDEYNYYELAYLPATLVFFWADT